VRRLTKEQLEVLSRAQDNFARLPSRARARRALWGLDLIESSRSTDGLMTKWRITPAGRSALAQSEE
jgi:hypothetical protein